MDVTRDDDVKRAAVVCTDVTLLINNAGVNYNTAFLLAPDLSIAREEIECNYLCPAAGDAGVRTGADRQWRRRAQHA